MEFPAPLIAGRLLRRYQRFLADVQLDSGETVTVHCPNSGSMATCKTPGQRVLLSHRPDPKRKLAYTWELYDSGSGWVCVNTQHPNAVVAEGIAAGRIPELAGYTQLRREVKYGGDSRIDILLEAPDRPACYVEVKNCTLLAADGRIRFPDAVTARGLKHLHALMEVVRQGQRAVMCFFIGRPDGRGFGPADQVDPAYGEGLRTAAAAGVEILAYRAHISPGKIELIDAVDVDLRRPDEV
ncbi:MAG: DNA/RNA nuclease SfsA [Pseudomonadota bacterium]